jgi:hypothetical protein
MVRFWTFQKTAHDKVNPARILCAREIRGYPGGERERERKRAHSVANAADLERKTNERNKLTFYSGLFCFSREKCVVLTSEKGRLGL